MDSIASGYYQAVPVDTDVYEYRGDDFLPIDNNAAALLVCQEEFLASSDSERLSLQGTGSQQSSLPQDFYRTSSQQSSLTSSSQRFTSGVSVTQIVRVKIWLAYYGTGTWASASTVSPEGLTAFACSLGWCMFALWYFNPLHCWMYYHRVPALRWTTNISGRQNNKK